ncbi:kinase-like protein [Rhypophila sp. PSN 637]
MSPSSQPRRLGLKDNKVSICLDRGEAAEAEHLRNHPETVAEHTRCHDHTGHTIISIIKCELDEACVPYPEGANRFFIPRRKLRSILSPERVLELIKHLTCCNHLSATQKKHLRDKICSPKTACWKLLAVLVGIGEQEQLFKLVELDLVSDRCLPIQPVDGPCNGQKDCHTNEQHHTYRIMAQWPKGKRREASVWSYMVKAPYFSRRRGQHNHYIFDINDVLPVRKTFSISSPNAPKSHRRTENGHEVFASGFSNVEKVELDESHFHFEGLEAWNRGSGGRRFALKTLHSRCQETFSNELASLISFQDQEDKHLIEVLATFEVVKEGKSTYHLLFPWAQGDLWAFWMNHGSRDQRIPRGLWMAQQIYHIAKALMAVHNEREQHLRQHPLKGVGDGNSRQIDLFGRHGDIKAENILWFEDKDSLVITDFGLGRINSKYSRSGVDPKSVDKTATYRAPEFDLSWGTISRASDIFSLGCMCLEFVTWYLLGWKAVVDEFPLYRTEPDIHDIDADTFFTIEGLVRDKDGKVIVRTNERALVKPRVREWIRKLRESEDSSCYTLQLLELIEEKMLEPVSSNRITSSELVRKLKVLADTCERTPSFYEVHCDKLLSRSNNTHRD